MKRLKPIGVLLSLALIVAMCFGSTITALAVGDPVIGTESAPAQAAINKVLQMPEGTTTPDAEFKFDVAKKSLDGSTATADLSTMPAIGTVTIDLSSGTTELPIVDGVKTVYKESSSLFADVNWPHAGIYVYTITEQSGTYITGEGESMSYSNGSYDISVYVENGTNGRYVAAIGALVVTPGAPGQEAGEKVDPRPGGDPEVSGDYSKMIFTNTYVKKSTGTEPDDSALTISKTVTGFMANKEKHFTFDLTVNKPAFVDDDPVYKVFVINSTSKAVETATANLVSGGTIKTDATYGDYIEITAGSPVSLKLKDNQTLSFIDTHVGATYTVTEAADADYKPSVTVVENGAEAVTTAPGTVNTELSTGKKIIGDSGINSAAFTNTRDTVTPTGISLDNLPFILILVLAGGALLTYLIVKVRKRAKAR